MNNKEKSLDFLKGYNKAIADVRKQINHNLNECVLLSIEKRILLKLRKWLNKLN